MEDDDEAGGGGDDDDEDGKSDGDDDEESMSTTKNWFQQMGSQFLIYFVKSSFGGGIRYCWWNKWNIIVTLVSAISCYWTESSLRNVKNRLWFSKQALPYL